MKDFFSFITGLIGLIIGITIFVAVVRWFGELFGYAWGL